jgi:hypothetical protein
MRVQSRVAAVLAGLCLTFSIAAAPPLADEDFSGLLKAGEEVARAGYMAEAREVVEILAGLGLSDAAKEQATRTLDRQAKVKPSEPGAKKGIAAGKKLATAAGVFAAGLADLPDEERRRVAEALVRIDGDCAAARAVLGRERGPDGRWRTEVERKRLARAAEFEDVLRRARHIPVELEDIEPDPIFAEATGKAGSEVRYGPVRVSGAHGRDQLRRIVSEAVRGTAVMLWLVEGRLEPPSFRPAGLYLTGSETEYKAVIGAVRSRGWISPELYREAFTLGGCPWYVGASPNYLSMDRTEASTEATSIECLMNFVQRSPAPSGHSGSCQPCLEAAAVNLVCLAFLGTAKKSLAWTESETERQQRTVAGPAAEKLRLQRRFPHAGLTGHRRRIRYLVEEDRDPPFALTMHDQIGRIQGDELIKATSVIEYLAMDGPLGPLLLATLPADIPAGMTAPAALEKALGRSLTDVEADWRRWLLDERASSIVERLGGATGSAWAPPTEAKAALDWLNRRRAETGLAATDLDEELCGATLLHARYLLRHPDQLEKWPDAHEEFPDREGFSAEGAWAGGHSVIMPGTRAPGEAVDGWIGTFYHRLPLLEPGLLLIGFACEKGVALLDAGSLCAPPELQETVLWPPDGARDVPVAFVPELPNPVPGENQSAFGYPVTLQTWLGTSDIGQRATLTLHEGGETGAEVPCHLSSPDAPTNPDLAPRNAWCLIPKHHLKAATRYTVVAEIAVDGGRKTWSFTTGKAR